MNTKDLFYDIFLKEKKDDKNYLIFYDEYKNFVNTNYNNFEVLSSKEFFKKIFGNYLYGFSIGGSLDSKEEICSSLIKIQNKFGSNEYVSFKRLFNIIEYILSKYKSVKNKSELVTYLKSIFDQFLEELINLFLISKDFNNSTFSIKYLLYNIYNSSSVNNDLDIDRTILNIVDNDFEIVGKLSNIKPLDSGDSRFKKIEFLNGIDNFFTTCMDTVNKFMEENKDLENKLYINKLIDENSYLEVSELMDYQRKFIKCLFITFIAVNIFCVFNTIYSNRI